jgi:hypothetical protein
VKRRSGLLGGLSILVLATAIMGSNASITIPNARTEHFLSTMTSFPTNPFYNPNYGYSSFRYTMRGTTGIDQVPIAVYSNTPSGNLICGESCPVNTLYNAARGTLYVPIGLASDYVTYDDCVSTICGISLANWSYKLPIGIPDYCSGQPTNLLGLDNSNRCNDVRGFDLQAGITGANGGILLTSANPTGDPTCTNYNGGTPDKGNVPSNSCWAADYAVVQSAQAVNPPCISGVTACITSSSVTATSNTTVVNPIFSLEPKSPRRLGTSIARSQVYPSRSYRQL